MSLDKNKKKKILSNVVMKTLKQPDFSKTTIAPIPAKKIYTNKMISDEADQIFTKNRKDLALKDGSFPLYGSIDATPNYNREYKRTLDQVRKTRKAMSK